MKYSASAGRMNKVHISVDGEYAYTVDSEYWYSCEWCRKSEIEDEEEVKKISYGHRLEICFYFGPQDAFLRR